MPLQPRLGAVARRLEGVVLGLRTQVVGGEAEGLGMRHIQETAQGPEAEMARAAGLELQHLTGDQLLREGHAVRAVGEGRALQPAALRGHHPHPREAVVGLPREGELLAAGVKRHVCCAWHWRAAWRLGR